MKAELTTGEIVTLPKDCNCSTHNDPHWTYMDRVTRAINRELLDPTDKTPEQRYYGAIGFAKEDLVRVEAKLRDMQQRGIVRLIPEASDEPTDEQRAQLEENRQWLLRRYEAAQPKPAEAPKTDDEVRRERNDRRDEVREHAKSAL
ncbi:hypothetical protein [Paraburkholderia sp.]|uniref:hypothetical protein n=1 Tax=Paraburkholderia sp. TaxID=1926495 RepID=UPI0025D1C35C|nr:hypothetical protein [Paraburkholderia sp.]